MKHLKLQIVVLLFSIGFSAVLGFGQERTWVDVTGKFQVKAKYLAVVDDKVVLRKFNGNVIRVPLSQLSQIDLDYLDSLYEAAKQRESAKLPQLNPNEPLSDSVKSAPNSIAVNAPEVGLPVKRKLKLDSTHFSVTDDPPKPKQQTANFVNSKSPNILGTANPGAMSNLKSTIPTSTSPNSNSPPASGNHPRVSNASAPIPKPKATPANPLEPSSARTNAKPKPPKFLGPTPIALPSIKVTAADIANLPRSVRDFASVLRDSADPRDVRNALSALDANWPRNNETILKLVRNTTTCDDKFCRLKSLALLGKYDLDESFPYILARMDDQSQQVRWTALELIQQSTDVRALQPLVERFIGKERSKVSRALLAYDDQAEPYLHKYLEHERADVRMETSLLLGKMGTQNSIPLLEKLAQGDPNPVVSLQAKSALRNIKKRTDKSK